MVRGVTAEGAKHEGEDDSVSKRRASAVERTATWFSMACAVHCLLVPLLALVTPLAGASGTFLDSPGVERALLAFVLVSASFAAFVGFRRHRDTRLVTLMGIGLCVYLAGHTLGGGWYAHSVAITGALVLAMTSFTSARLGHRHAEECAH